KRGGCAMCSEAVVPQEPGPAKPSSDPPPSTQGAPGAGQTFKFEKGLDKNYVLGRALINDESLSQMHAGFRFNGRVWQARDAGSTNGTWLDQQEIHKPRDWNQEKRDLGNWYEIRHGSVLRMGGVYLRLTLDGDGNLITTRISPWGSGWAAAGAPNGAPAEPPPNNWEALPPYADFTHFKMNGAQMLEIVKGPDHPGIYGDRKTKGLHFWVIEQSGLMGRLIESKKVFAVLMRMQSTYVIQSEVEDMKVVRGVETFPLKKGGKFQLQTEDRITFGDFSKIFLPY